MAQSFIVCDREQELLLPPCLREWLPEVHSLLGGAASGCEVIAPSEPR